jgi:RNA polymerase sigma-70 factor (ECF subfamily)
MEEAELRAVYEQFAPLVYARARRLLRTEAEDVVQDVFERYLRRKPKEEGELLHWFYRVSTNLCLDRIRYRARRDQNWWQSIETESVPAISSQESAIQQDLCRELLAHLDKKSQAVVILTFFDDMNADEVATTLGVSRKTVVNRLARFRQIAAELGARWHAEVPCPTT